MGRQPAVTYRSDKAHRVFSSPTASYLSPQPDHPFESKNEKTVFFNTTFDNHWKQFLNLQPKFTYHEQKAFLIGNLLRHTACFIMHNINPLFFWVTCQKLDKTDCPFYPLLYLWLYCNTISNFSIKNETSLDDNLKHIEDDNISENQGDKKEAIKHKKTRKRKKTSLGF